MLKWATESRYFDKIRRPAFPIISTETIFWLNIFYSIVNICWLNMYLLKHCTWLMYNVKLFMIWFDFINSVNVQVHIMDVYYSITQQYTGWICLGTYIMQVYRNTKRSCSFPLRRRSWFRCPQLVIIFVMSMILFQYLEWCFLYIVFDYPYNIIILLNK